MQSGLTFEFVVIIMTEVALVAVVLEQKMEQEEVSLAVAAGIYTGVCTTFVSVLGCEQATVLAGRDRGVGGRGGACVLGCRLHICPGGLQALLQ